MDTGFGLFFYSLFADGRRFSQILEETEFGVLNQETTANGSS